MSDSVLELRGLRKTYKDQEALCGLDLNLSRQKVVGLLGPNGSGKTTLIKLIAGLLVPTDGEILICGMKPGVESKKIVSYLPDHTFLIDWMTIKQSVEYHADFFEDFKSDRAYRMIADLGLDPGAKIKTLSKGNKEKVALILCMSRDAALYLLDEPIAGVDPATRDYILHTIISNRHENSTVLLSTHLIADVEPVLDEVIFLNRGNLERYSSVQQIRETEGKSVDEVFREVYRW